MPVNLVPQFAPGEPRLRIDQRATISYQVQGNYEIFELRGLAIPAWVKAHFAGLDVRDGQRPNVHRGDVNHVFPGNVVVAVHFIWLSAGFTLRPIGPFWRIEKDALIGRVEK